MFRFVEASKEWKERGTGDVRFLRHKEDKKIRVLMRAEKTLRVRANHPRQSFPSLPLSLPLSLFPVLPVCLQHAFTSCHVLWDSCSCSCQDSDGVSPNVLCC